MNEFGQVNYEDCRSGRQHSTNSQSRLLGIYRPTAIIISLLSSKYAKLAPLFHMIWTLQKVTNHILVKTFKLSLTVIIKILLIIQERKVNPKEKLQQGGIKVI